MMTKKELASLGRGALLAAAGAVLAYLAETGIPAIQESGTGVTLTIAAVASVLVNAARKWFSTVDV